MRNFVPIFFSLAFVLYAMLAVVVSSSVTGTKAGGPVGKCPEVDGEFAFFLPDLKGRNIYYECSHGRPILMNCSGDLLFNTKLNTCAFPDMNCEPCGPVGSCPGNGGNATVPLRDGCNISTFYNCDAGKPVMGTCPNAKIYDAYKGECV